MQICSKAHQKMHFLHHSRKLVQIRSHESADTEMPKCLAGKCIIVCNLAANHVLKISNTSLIFLLTINPI